MIALVLLSEVVILMTFQAIFYTLNVVHTTLLRKDMDYFLGSVLIRTLLAFFIELLDD